MEITKRQTATILAALRYWQVNFDNEPADLFEDYFFNVTPLSEDEIDDLCEKLNCPPAGYVVINLSKPMPVGDGKYDFYVTGEEHVSYGNLEDAADQVATRMHEDGHTQDSIGIYALHPVVPEETDPLVNKALKNIEDEVNDSL